MRALLATAILAIALAGCGSDDKQASKSYTEDDVMQTIKAKPDAYGITYVTVRGCEAAVILDSSEEVALYRDAGDTVVTNPAGNAGVKAAGQTPACLAEFKQRLATLR